MRPGLEIVPFHTALRVVTIILVTVVSLSTRRSEALWSSVVFSVGFGHYALSLIYAKGQVRRVFTEARPLGGLLALCGLCWILYARQFSLLLAFGVHHVFNEVYLSDRALRGREVLLAKWLRFARVALNAFIFFFLLMRDAPQVAGWNRPLLYGGFVASAVLVLVLIVCLRGTLARTALVDLCAFETIGVLMVALSYWVEVRFLDLVLYHFVFWALYPLPKLIERGPVRAWNYAGLNLLLTASFFLLSPASPFPSLFTSAGWLDQFRFWSYFHIATAFAFSTAFPGWITRWFQPARVPAPAS